MQMSETLIFMLPTIRVSLPPGRTFHNSRVTKKMVYVSLLKTFIDPWIWKLKKLENVRSGCNNAKQVRNNSVLTVG